MKILRCCSIVVIGLLLATASAFPQVLKGSHVPLNVKLGLWEVTSVAEMSGAPPIDTSKMTPEQRTRMETALKAFQANAAKPHTFHSCLTKEKLEKDLFGHNDKNCQQTVLSSSATSYAVKFDCGGDHPSSGEWHFVALTPESVKGGGTFTMEGKAKSTSTMTGKWIGAACGDVK